MLPPEGVRRGAHPSGHSIDRLGTDDLIRNFLLGEGLVEGRTVYFGLRDPDGDIVSHIHSYAYAEVDRTKAWEVVAKIG